MMKFARRMIGSGEERKPRGRREARAVPTYLALCVVLTACLPTVGCRSRPHDAPQVHLNHFYVVVDTATFASLAANDFMRERFAAFSRDTTVADEGRSWVGLYWFGENTYIEVLRASAARAAGGVGIGLSVDRAGDLEKLADGLSAAGLGDYESGLMTRESGGNVVPWMHWLEYGWEAPGPELACWIQAYHEDYLLREFPARSPGEQGLARHEYLERYFDPGRFLEDVVEVTLALEAGRIATLRRMLSVCGYAIEDASGCVAQGPGVAFRLVAAAEDRRGLLEARMSTTRAAAGDGVTVELGTTTLVMHPAGGATWRFQ